MLPIALTPAETGEFADGAVLLIAGAIFLMVGYRYIGPSNKIGFSADDWYARNGRKFRMIAWAIITCGACLTMLHLPIRFQ